MEYETKRDIPVDQPLLYQGPGGHPPVGHPPGDQYPPPYSTAAQYQPAGGQYPPPPPGAQYYGQSPYSQPSAPYQPGVVPPYGMQPGYPPMGYAMDPHLQQQQQPQVIVMSPAHPVVVHQPQYVSMIGAIVLSCFTFWCCGLLLGLIAFILAMVGQCYSSGPDTRTALQLRNASYGVSVAGIIVGIVVTVLLFTLGASNRHH